MEIVRDNVPPAKDNVHQEEEGKDVRRPFLSYSRFKQQISRADGSGSAEEIGSPSAPHCLSRVLKRFPDGRLWLEVGGHEMLLANSAGGGWEADGLANPSPEETEPPANCHCESPHLANCLFSRHSPMMLSSLAATGSQERMPICAFVRQFKCLLSGPGHSGGHLDERECVRKVMRAAGVADHRFRLGLSLVLLQRGVLEDLERKRALVLADLVAGLQAECRRHLLGRWLARRRREVQAVLCVQRNLVVWAELAQWDWWRLFARLRPILPAIRGEQRERQWRLQLVQLQTELEQLKGRAAKAVGQPGGREDQEKLSPEEEAENKASEMKDFLGQLIMPPGGGHQQREEDEGMNSLQRELAECRERLARQRAGEQLEELEAKLVEERAKWERAEARSKRLEEEMTELRDQLERAMGERDESERRRTEAEKEIRRRGQLQKELEERETEMEELRKQHQRRVRALEAQLEEMNGTILRQKQLARAGRSPSVTSLYQHEGNTPIVAAEGGGGESHSLRRKLCRARALVQSLQSQIAHERAQSRLKGSQFGQLRDQIEETELARASAQRAQFGAESELSQLRAQLDNAVNAKLGAEQKTLLAMRERNASSTLARALEDQLQEALCRERMLAQQSRTDGTQLAAYLQQIGRLEKQMRQKSYDGNSQQQEEARNDISEGRKERELAELRLREVQAGLEMETANRRRAEALTAKLGDETESLKQQLAEIRTERERESETHRQLRKQKLALEEQMAEAKRREVDWTAKQRTLKRECIRLEEEWRTTAADLKLANRRLDILQRAISADFFVGPHGDSIRVSDGEEGLLLLEEANATATNSSEGDDAESASSSATSPFSQK